MLDLLACGEEPAPYFLLALRLVAFLLGAAFFLAVLRFAVLRLAVVFRFAVLRLAVVFRLAAGFALRLRTGFLAAVFLLAVFLLAVFFLAIGIRFTSFQSGMKKRRQPGAVYDASLLNFLRSRSLVPPQIPNCSRLRSA